VAASTPPRAAGGLGASPSLLRRLNSTLILETIRSDGPISRASLARATGLSKPTVNQVAELLLEQGFVEETAEDGAGTGPRRPGPRARLLRFRADLGHVLGIDVGADHALALVADLSGRIVATGRRDIGERPARNRVLAQLEGAARDALAAAGLTADAIRSAGVGTPGIVDPASGRISLAPQIDGWDGLDLGGHLQGTLGCPVVADNETRLSLLAECWRGAARGVADAAYVQVGIGIGGAILIGGTLHRGKSGAAGEIAYMLDVVDGDEPVAAAGTDGSASVAGAGPFERAAGGRAYARFGSSAARGPGGELLRELAGGDPDAVSARTVFAAADRGDPAAAAIVARLTERLGRGVANVATVLDPDLLVLGGGIANAGAALLDPIERAVRAAVPSPPRVVLSELGDDGAALGAVRRALDHADALLFSFDPAGA
jgi:predicted NBD/HSP70 family sugar kinase